MGDKVASTNILIWRSGRWASAHLSKVGNTTIRMVGADRKDGKGSSILKVNQSGLELFNPSPLKTIEKLIRWNLRRI
jgi:hypothetical protein